jgi:putative acetyltransferase
VSVLVRPEQRADFPSITDVVTDAFGDTGREVALLVERIRASDEYEPGLALVAEDESEVIGHVMLSWVGLASTVRERVLCLSPMSVRTDRQRRGVGSQLIRAVLDLADDRGEPLVMLEGIPDYYPRFGFERARPLGFEPPKPHIPDAAFMVKRLQAYDPAIAGRITYSAAFDALTDRSQD